MLPEFGLNDAFLSLLLIIASHLQRNVGLLLQWTFLSQEECASLKRRLEKEKKNVLYGAADEILLEETKQYKVILPTVIVGHCIENPFLVVCYVRFSDGQILTSEGELPYLWRKMSIKLGIYDPLNSGLIGPPIWKWFIPLSTKGGHTWGLSYLLNLFNYPGTVFLGNKFNIEVWLKVIAFFFATIILM